MIPAASLPGATTTEEETMGTITPMEADSLRLDIPTSPLMPELMFVSDVRGRIQCWSSLVPLPEIIPDPTGAQIRELLPALPLRQDTPGYNVAYIRMSFHGGRWQGHEMRLRNGASAPVRLQIHTISLERGYCLAGRLSLPLSAPPADAAALPHPRRQAEERRRRDGVAPLLLLDFARTQNERRADTLNRLAS